MFPLIAYADVGTGAAAFIQKLITLIVNPLIYLMFAIAIVVFTIGMIKFIAASDKTAEDAKNGKQHMLWGILGLFIMIAVFGIMQVLVRTFGTEDDLPEQAREQIF